MTNDKDERTYDWKVLESNGDYKHNALVSDAFDKPEKSQRKRLFWLSD